MGSTAPFDDRIHALRPQPGQRRVATRLRELLAGSPIVASHADCGRVQDPYTLRCIPQVLGAVSDALDYVEANARARADGRHRQPARLPGRGRRRVGRQLPRAAAVAGARPPRACPVRARLVLGAAHVRAALAVLRGAAALPDPPSRPQLRPHDRAVRAGGARLGVHGAVPPGRGRVDSDVGGPGGLQLDGRACGPEGANGRRARLARRRLRARLRLSGPRVPPPAPHHRAARGGARRRCGERIPRVEHDRSLSDELAVLARDIRLGELALP